MTFQHKPNRGSLFRNKKKEKQDQPDYRGDALIDGTEYWISAWLNEGPKGKYFSFSFQPKDEARNQGMAQARNATSHEQYQDAVGGNEFDEDSIPF